jgi:hypothetical protein
MTEQITIVIYSTYTDAQKRAIKKYRENNREKVNELAKKYYEDQKKDPEYMKMKRERSRKYYLKKKAEKINLKN